VSNTVLVFVHGINEKLPVREEMRRWRDALAAGHINPDQLGLNTTFGYYADWFFAGSNEPELAADNDDVLSETAARIESKLSSGPSKLSPDAEEALFGIDISTFVPQRMVRLFLEKTAGQLFQYFDDEQITHPAKTNTRGGAREVIREAIVDAIARAREIADRGEKDGRVIVVAHSMGSVVAWDVIAHDERCPEVNGLVTLGSPLALDFVLNGLEKANRDEFRGSYPGKLSGDWYNFIAHHDLVGQFDVDFVSNFGMGAFGQKIYSREIDNPELMSGQGPWQRLQSAHSVTGYLRHPEVADALTKLSERDITGPPRVAGKERTSRRGDRRAMMISKESQERFHDTETRRRQISAGQGGRLGLAQFETRERIIKKLSLMDVPKDLAKSLLDQAGSGSETGSISLERILGSNDFITSSFALKAAALTSAVGKLEVAMQGIGTWSGTGFMISENLLMTNNHVLATPEEAAAATLLLDYSYSSEEEERNAVRYALRPDQFFITSDSRELDYTIVAVDVPEGGLQRPWFQLIGGSGKALLGDHVNIIQHPDGRRQEIVVRNSAVTYVDDAKDYVYYEADTEGGSSGSPVCNDQWQLAFLHHASVPQRDDEGYVLRTDGERYRNGEPDSDIHWISNEGIRISRIVKDVRTKLLSTGQHEMFDACFEDPDLTQYIHIAPKTLRNGAQGPGSSEIAGGGTGGPRPAPYPSADGSMSWLFELSFGPAGGMRAGPIGAAPASGPSPAITGHGSTPRLSPPVKPQTIAAQTYSPGGPKDGILRDAAERLIERARIEDDYYDEDKDAASIDAYYMDTPTSGGEVTLYKEYRKLLRLTHSKEFSYSKARLSVLYPYADRHEDDSLKSVYSGETLDAKDVIATELATILRSSSLPMLGQEMLIEGDWLDIILDAADNASALEASDPYNCEHVVPQSWFNKRQPMKADLHHLFTCEPKCNSFRNKFAYAEFETYEAGHIDPEEAALRKTCGYRDLLSGNTHFEPEQNKGAVARATLYFLLRYPGEIGDADGEYTTEDLATLISWHEDEPPSLWEKHRNRTIFLNQGNRNPLIDLPELGSRIGFHKGLIT